MPTARGFPFSSHLNHGLTKAWEKNAASNRFLELVNIGSDKGSHPKSHDTIKDWRYLKIQLFDNRKQYITQIPEFSLSQ